MAETDDREGRTGPAGERRSQAGRTRGGALLALALAAGLLAGCGPRTYRGMLVENNAIAQAMLAVQQAEQAAFAEHIYDGARHERYAATITAIRNDGPAIDRALRAWRLGDPEPEAVKRAAGQLQAMLTDLGTLQVPPSTLLASLEHAIGLLTVRPAGG